MIMKTLAFAGIMSTLTYRFIYKRLEKTPEPETDKVKVKYHTRKYPGQADTKEFRKFEKNHLRGLKAMNPVKFARKKRIKRLEIKMDNFADKCEHYFKLGEFKKAEQCGKRVAEIDKEITGCLI